MIREKKKKQFKQENFKKIFILDLKEMTFRLGNHSSSKTEVNPTNIDTFLTELKLAISEYVKNILQQRLKKMFEDVTRLPTVEKPSKSLKTSKSQFQLWSDFVDFSELDS